MWDIADGCQIQVLATGSTVTWCDSDASTSADAIGNAFLSRELTNDLGFPHLNNRVGQDAQ